MTPKLTPTDPKKTGMGGADVGQVGWVPGTKKARPEADHTK